MFKETALDLLDALFSGWQRYRRWRGGHWERWIIDFPVVSQIWMQRDHGQEPPALGRCTPTCEDWNK